MLLQRTGRYRDRGTNVLFGESDLIRISAGENEDGALVEISVIASRRDASSYNYELRLIPEEVVYCFLSLDASALEEAVREISDRYDLRGWIPPRVAHLVRGVMPRESDEPAGGGRSRDRYQGTVELVHRMPSQQPSS